MWEKYKEADPRETVERIRNALAGVGVRMEPVYMHPVGNVVSVLLRDPEHGFETYGKGTSEEWALASAYGEAAERFQNRMVYPIPEPEEGGNMLFHEWPDEERISLADALGVPDIAEDIARHYLDPEVSAEDFFRELYGTDTVSAVPFLSVRQNATVMLPDRVIGTLCGSNGLASGNTYDEALCQGLCEAAERYAKFYMIRENIPLVTVPEEEIVRRCPELFGIMKEIEKGTGCRMTVRDARPVTGFPVLQVLLTDNVRQKYYTRFGCHPVFTVALERCITELLQGQEDITRLSTMLSWPQERETGSYRNLGDSVKADLGDLTDEFLSGVTDAQFEPWPETVFTNRGGVNDLIGRFLRIAPDVYIRKTGFLGIPSVRIHIPGVTPLPFRYSSRVLEYNRVRKILHDPYLMGRKPDRKTLEQMYNAFTADDSLVGSRMDWRPVGIGYDEMKGLLLYMLGRDPEAAEAFGKAASSCGKCMYHQLRLRQAGKEAKVRQAVLELFFGRKVSVFTEKVCADRENALAVWLDPTGLYRQFASAVSVANTALPLCELEKTVKERMKTVYDGRSSDQRNGVFAQ